MIPVFLCAMTVREAALTASSLPLALVKGQDPGRMHMLFLSLPSASYARAWGGREAPAIPVILDLW